MKQINNSINKRNIQDIIFKCVLYTVVGILVKILPHSLCMTPLNNFYLHTGSKFSKMITITIVVLSMLIGDVILSRLYNYPIFGWWSLFTYSGFIFISFLGSQISSNCSRNKLIVCIISTSLLFWIWTNFGAWLLISNYPKNLSGLITCYIMALPFLKAALFSDLVWSLIVFYPVYWHRSSLTYNHVHYAFSKKIQT